MEIQTNFCKCGMNKKQWETLSNIFIILVLENILQFRFIHLLLYSYSTKKKKIIILVIQN